MATKAQEIFDLTMAMIDETTDTQEYKDRTLPILNILRNELYPYSDTYDNSTGGRPIATKITAFDRAIDLDDYICQTVMPYGLAAHLLADENPSLASFYNGRYMELFSELRRGMPAQIEDVEDIFGTDVYNEFGRW